MSTPPLQLRDRAPDRDVVGVEHDAEGEVMDGDEDDRVETLLAELRDRRVVQRTGNRAAPPTSAFVTSNASSSSSFRSAGRAPALSAPIWSARSPARTASGSGAYRP